MNRENALSVVASEKLDFVNLLAIARDVVTGLQYLHSKQIVHADLALRNVLLTKRASDEAKYLAKVSDFGLSKTLYGSSYYKSEDKTIPVRWSAIEVIEYGKYSYSSDMWSLGVLFWELFNAGKVPYPGLSNEDVVAKIQKGQNLNEDQTPPEIYQWMLKMWSRQPNERPTVSEFYTIIDQLWVKNAPLVKSVPVPTSLPSKEITTTAIYENM